MFWNHQNQRGSRVLHLQLKMVRGPVLSLLVVQWSRSQGSKQLMVTDSIVRLDEEDHSWLEPILF